MATEPLRRGVVAEFDEHVGLGAVRAEDGSVLPFHCTQIAGGTRTIAVDAVVTFVRRPGPLGRWEATSVTPG